MNDAKIEQENEFQMNLSLILKDKVLKIGSPFISSPINVNAKRLYKKDDGLTYYHYVYKHTPNEAARAKVLVVLGATGAGKTTLLNAMINFVLGVKREDKHRYKIIHETQAESRVG